MIEFTPTKCLPLEISSCLGSGNAPSSVKHGGVHAPEV